MAQCFLQRAGSSLINIPLPLKNEQEIKIGKFGNDDLYIGYFKNKLERSKSKLLIPNAKAFLGISGTYIRNDGDKGTIGYRGDDNIYSFYPDMIYLQYVNNQIILQNRGSTSYFNPIDYELYVFYTK